MALSGAAILAVYAAGYARTQAAADRAPAGSASPSVTVAKAAPVRSSSSDDGGQRQEAEKSSAAQSSPARSTGGGAAAAATKSAASGYRNGTFTGTGWSRHGSVQVAVSIKSGRIVAAVITGCGMRYPCSWIAQLPGEVIARQSAQVDFVSGATDSSLSFQRAVTQALQQAVQ